MSQPEEAEDDTAQASSDSRISQDDAVRYWSSLSADNDSMLGGYAHISRIDLQGSANFINKLRRRSPSTGGTVPAANGLTTRSGKAGLSLLPRAVDCGAGIGRITRGMLVSVAEIVDVVEPVEKFTNEVSNGADFADLRSAGKIGDVYTLGLETWTPEKNYDLIWNQWCLGQLRNEQLAQYLRRCVSSLTPTGWIVVKENISTDSYGEDIFDDQDSSITRSDTSFRSIFESAGLKIVATELQRGFPTSLFPVRMYALQAAS